jgi:hypothetical protein
VKIQVKARLAFPDLFTAVKIGDDPNSEPKFSGIFIIEPPSNCTIIKQDESGNKTREASNVKNVISAVAKEKWKDKAGGVLTTLRQKDRVCHRETPKLNKSGDVYDGFQGMHWIQASNGVKPLVLDRNKAPLTAQDGKPYAGCYVIATLDLWAQDNRYGQRINATLLGVQFDRDGDAFSGGAPADADDFDDLGDGADADSDIA